MVFEDCMALFGVYPTGVMYLSLGLRRRGATLG